MQKCRRAWQWVRLYNEQKKFSRVTEYQGYKNVKLWANVAKCVWFAVFAIENLQ